MAQVVRIYGGMTSDYNTYKESTAEFGKVWENIINEFSKRLPKGTYLRGHGFESFFPRTQYLVLDALDKKDWPHNIDINSVFIGFKVDLLANTVEVFRQGHIWLTPADQKKSYLAMCSMRDAVKAQGGKWMRKTTFKSAEDLAKKVIDFYSNTMALIDKATGGYPYKQMQINIY